MKQLILLADLFINFWSNISSNHAYKWPNLVPIVWEFACVSVGQICRYALWQIKQLQDVKVNTSDTLFPATIHSFFHYLFVFFFPGEKIHNQDQDHVALTTYTSPPLIQGSIILNHYLSCLFSGWKSPFITSQLDSVFSMHLEEPRLHQQMFMLHATHTFLL